MEKEGNARRVDLEAIVRQLKASHSIDLSYIPYSVSMTYTVCARAVDIHGDTQPVGVHTLRLLPSPSHLGAIHNTVLVHALATSSYLGLQATWRTGSLCPRSCVLSLPFSASYTYTSLSSDPVST